MVEQLPAGAKGFAEDAARPPVMEFLSSGEGLQLSLAFMRIKDAKVRKRVLDLVKSLAEDAGDDFEIAEVLTLRHSGLRAAFSSSPERCVRASSAA